MSKSHTPLRILFALAAAYAANAGALTPEADFAARCAQPGVISCIGFDTQAETNAVGQTRAPNLVIANPQAYPNNLNGSFRYPGVDNGLGASGGGSLRVTANPVGYADHSGGWYYGEQGPVDWAQTFGAGSTVYVQWRQRFDKAFTNDVNWGSTGANGLKNIILWRNEGSCSDMEVTIQNNFNRGYPQAYSNCGGVPFYWCPTGESGDTCRSNNINYPPMAGHSTFVLNSGPLTTDFRCLYNATNAATCPLYRDNYDKWWTFLIKVKVGSPGVAATEVDMWVSRGNGEPMRQFIDFGPYAWGYASGSKLQNLMFTLYGTDKNNGNHVPATSWYDELIISTQPIRAPESVGAGPAPDVVPPAPPSGLVIQ